MLEIKEAMPLHLPAITEIYNDAVLNTVATFDTKPKTIRQQEAWLAGHDSKQFPVLVGEENGVVVAWASLSRYSDRCAYDQTAEISVYVAAARRGQGYGKYLVEVITERGRLEGLHTIVARITQGNASSVHIHEALGYQQVGVLREVGNKFGQQLDVHIMQKVFD